MIRSGIITRDVKRLRALLRDRDARDENGLFVCEGPRVDRGRARSGASRFDEVFVGVDATPAAGAVADRAAEYFIPVRELAEGVADKVSATTTAPGVFAVAPLRARRCRGARATRRSCSSRRASPIPATRARSIRSAAAAGAEIIVLGPGSVDAYNPKTVRASAGACFAVRIVEGVPAVEALEALGKRRRSPGRRAGVGRERAESVDLTGPDRDRARPRGARPRSATCRSTRSVTIPMHGAESLNVAMAGTLLLFEAARQRRATA